MDDTLIRGVQRITNTKLKREYPLMEAEHYSELDVKLILESLAMILEEYELSKTPGCPIQ